jgi:hypothetical protein
LSTILFDVFHKEASGSVLWRAGAATMEEAKARVQEFAMSVPGDYVILNVRTGNKLLIRPDGAAVEQAAREEGKP